MCIHFRSADVPTRQRYVALVESVKDGGGTVRVFSSLHVSGERKESRVVTCNLEFTKLSSLLLYRARSAIRSGSYLEISSPSIRRRQ